jgi:hypothetical protein
MKRRLLILIGLPFLAAVLLATGLVYKRKQTTPGFEKSPVEVKAAEEKPMPASPETSTEETDINLDLSMNYAKLKGLLREKELPRNQADRVYLNAVIVQWNKGVYATFLGGEPRDDQKPVGIKIATGGGMRFKGSICGVRLGDQLDQASAAMAECGCRVTEKHFKTGTWYVDVIATCRLNQRLSMHFSDAKIQSLSLWDKQYVAQSNFP